MPTLLEQEDIALTLGDTFSAEKNFAELVFQRTKPVLDTELVEMQRIASHREKLRAMLFGTLFLDTTFKVTEKVGADNDFVVQPGEFSSGSLLYTLKDSFDYSGQAVTYPLTRKFLWNADIRVPALSTPSVARVDLVVLTLVTRVILGSEDSSIVNPIVNRETAVRTKIECGISVLEGFSGNPSALAQYFTYENSEHCFRFPIAMLHREAGNSKITGAMIIDLRSRVVSGTDLIPLLKNGGMEIPGSLVVAGDFTVRGTQTIIDTTELDVKDNIIRLNKGVESAPSLDAGIEVIRGTSPNSRLLWNESSDRWSCGILGALHTIAFDDEVLHLQGEETIQGLKTFSTLPKSSSNPSVDDEFTRRGYVDSEITKGLNKKLDKTLLTTKGDIIFAGTDGVPSTLPAGSNKQVLTIVDGSPVWVEADVTTDELSGVAAEAKGYTDAQVSLLSDAMEQGDTATLNNAVGAAKTYTDSKAAILEGSISTGDETTLNNAKGYTDTKVGSIQKVPTADKLATSRKINGTEFDGTADISIDHLVDHVLQSSVKAEILAAMNDSVGVFRTFSGPAGLTDAPNSASTWRYIAFRFPYGNLHVIALVPGGFHRQECLYDGLSSKWGGWVETQTSTGAATAVVDNQSNRTILVKSGRVIITGSVGAVTFASAFPNQLLFATYHLESSGPFLAATGTTAGIQLVASTSGTYNWIAWGY